MPKFVSGSSGTVYDQSGLVSADTESDNQDFLVEANKQADIPNKKPSAINKKDNKSKSKSKLESFKEELKRIQEEREERQRQKKLGLDDPNKSILSAPRSQPVPVPLKPDPRCPTPLTLAIKSVSSGHNSGDDQSGRGLGYGSHDNGDPTTTNVYLGSINPIVNENDLCDLFGKYGPLASIKVMWPRTEEEKARNRNCGFVAFMSRKDAERALKALNGKEYKNYEMKLGKYISSILFRMIVQWVTLLLVEFEKEMLVLGDEAQKGDDLFFLICLDRDKKSLSEAVE